MLSVFGEILSIALGIFIFLIFVAVSAYAGYSVVKNYKGNLLTSTVVGVFVGRISGILSWIIGILMVILGIIVDVGTGDIGGAILDGFTGILVNIFEGFYQVPSYRGNHRRYLCTCRWCNRRCERFQVV